MFLDVWFLEVNDDDLYSSTGVYVSSQCVPLDNLSLFCRHQNFITRCLLLISSKAHYFMLFTRQLTVRDVSLHSKFSRPSIPCYVARSTRSRSIASRDSKKMPPRNKILCVAEKNSISKAVAGHLSGGDLITVRRYYVSPRNDLLNDG
jgi:hypothetical protein